MVRTLLSDHTRLAAGAIVGAITAALFIEGLIAGPPQQDGGGDRAVVTEGTESAPEPLPAVVDGLPPMSTTTAPSSTTTTTTTTTTTKRPSTTTTTTTTVPPTTTTTTVRPTTTTTTRTCRILC